MSDFLISDFIRTSIGRRARRGMTAVTAAEQRGQKPAIVAICIGVRQGIAVLIVRV